MLPLSLWELHGHDLPDSLCVFPKASSFSLPGVQALESFADLIGQSDDSAPETCEAEDEAAPFALPAMLPDDLSGAVTLRREIDFGSLHGDRAVLTIDHIIGRGRILLGENVLCTFDSTRFTDEALSSARAMSAQPCQLAVDLSDALELGRKETLVIEFEALRPAGLPGPVMLHVTSCAHLSQVSLLPDAKQQTISVSAQISCAEKGRYVLRAQGFSSSCAPTDARETPLVLSKGETRAVHFSFHLPAAPLVPGRPHDAPAVKLQLFLKEERMHGDGLLCDSATLLCGYAPAPPAAWMPLDRAAAFAPTQETINSIQNLGVPAVSLHFCAPDSLYRALSRAGIAVRQYLPKDHPLRDALSRFPCICPISTPEPAASISLEASAWQLCSMVSAPRAIDEMLSSKELLREASGLPLDSKETSVHDALLWLRALSIRLRAEAARQRRYHGALCAPGEQENPDVAAALKTAFAPLHLSALPLCGAWWTSTRFSAVLESFLPDGVQKTQLLAQAVLEDDEGKELARFESPCRLGGGYVGVIEALLPDYPCVLELTTRLLDSDGVLEENTLPVYVGDRGQLEAAFI